MNKIEFIDNNKKILDTIINELLNVNIINNINSLLKQYNEFILFINITYVIEMYIYNNIKLEYINIKKIITNYKKKYKKLIILYGDIICYYNINENEIINDNIKIIKEKNEINIFNFEILKKKYKDNNLIFNSFYNNKKKYIIINDFINLKNIKSINLLINEIKIIIEKIYTNYLDFIKINNDIKIIKKKKININNNIFEYQINNFNYIL
jgi:hypothetical protein